MKSLTFSSRVNIAYPVGSESYGATEREREREGEREREVGRD